MVIRLVFMLLLPLLMFGTCTRSSQKVKNQSQEVDSTQLKIIPTENLGKKMDDIYYLLQQGYDKANLPYDSIQFELIHDPALQDSIRIVTLANNSVKITVGKPGNKVVSLYSYLEILGYRFYGPEDHWTYIPVLDINKDIDTLIQSTFLLRQFNPTFSVGPRNNDNFAKARQLYSRWMDRLRNVNNLKLKAGHYGSEFNRRYKNQINQNPDWRSKDQNGDPHPWSNELKLCYTNLDVIELYKKDAKRRLLEMIRTQPPPYFVNMEPPDGGNFCQCEQCPDSVSDQVYGLANEIAIFLKKINPDANVWLIAYNEHSPPPSFELAGNILIGIVPYAFQNNYSPAEFTSIWENKVDKLFLRDYLAIPLWNFDEPSWQSGLTFLDRIKHLKNNGYIGYNFESTASFLAVGWPMYLISQEAWTDIDYEKELKLFQSRMFSTSGLDLESLIDYFADTKNSSYYLGNLKQLIETAKSNCSDEGELERINDFETYFDYIVLRNEYKQRSGEDKVKARNRILNFVYSNSNSLNLHTWGIYRSMVQNRSSTPFGKMLKVDQRKQPRNFTLRSSKPKISEFIPYKPTYKTEVLDTLPVVSFSNDVTALVYVSEESDLTIKVKVRNVPSTKYGNGIVSLLTMDGVELDNFRFEHQNNLWNHIEFEVPKGNQFYKLRFANPASRMSVQGPNRPFAFSDPLDTGVLPKNLQLWTYIPDGRAPEIIFKYLTRNVIIKKDDGRVVDKFFVEEPRKYELSVHGIISLTTTKASFQLLGVPHLFSPQKKQVIKFHLK